MTELTILRGVPASGKSTTALELQQAQGVTRVNRDDIRFMLFGKYWGVDEDVVTTVENAAIEAALRAGQDVALDATNLNAKALRTKLSLASRYGASVTFLDSVVSLEEAVRRDAARERQVGENVINSFFRRYKIDPVGGVLPKALTPLPSFEKYTADNTKRLAYIIDTDGTVADHRGVRSPYDTSKYSLDNPIDHMVRLVKAIYASGHAVIGVSGRDVQFKDETTRWWADQGLAFDDFFMRPKGDTRMDAIVKYELFKEHIEPDYNVLGAFDDRPQVIRMWRTIGVPVLDVGDGLEF